MTFTVLEHAYWIHHWQGHLESDFWVKEAFSMKEITPGFVLCFVLGALFGLFIVKAIGLV